MTRVTWIGGALFASLAAGPVFTLALAVTLVLQMSGSDGSPLVGFGVIFALSLPVGFVLALLPNIAGTALLARSGLVWPAARHPLLWAATGAALGWLIGMAAVGGLMAIPLAATGAACALLCRRGTTWLD